MKKKKDRVVKMSKEQNKKANTKKGSVSKTMPKKTPKKMPKKRKKTTLTINQTKNNYTNFIIGLIIIIIILGLGSLFFKKNNSEPEYIATKDEQKFKNDYESLNGKENTKKVSIKKDNNISYIDLQKAHEILETGSGVIYFGYASDPWSRNAITVLLDAAGNFDLDNIYYVDIRPDNDVNNDIRDLFELNSSNKAKRTKDGNEYYSDVLIDMANYLRDYTLSTASGKIVNTGEKRINTPTVVAVLDGTIVAFHEGTVEGHNLVDDKLPNLSNEQIKKLNQAYTELISKYLDDSCPLESDEGC